MYELNHDELEMINGGAAITGGAQGFGYVVGYGIGSVIAAGGYVGGTLGNFGSWLGGEIYDALH